ncbi:23S rRNA (guanosine(2251)-2'-O)-methyltransferase RlmB [Acetobacter conturbans]|uniref:23S rRNA (Guanosine(2251)-2'-O)-methyltransferase RlmB n=1 Tax=Acetobacter conturbans TaxID=1737472 RepID=A0ABX0JZ14_9PROT|nr:23S rRNA (guanosine(2251)-2'-O)-methyltransferase RlmB [Acetobacter conturbans]NHN87786.1 23S rRNA (guanosine(2251)-2'-O)-methyltransferase RlmB [Acetobacter conturbans]
MRTPRHTSSKPPSPQNQRSGPPASSPESRGGQRQHGKGRPKPGGPYWIAGVHACQAALENPHRTVQRVLLSAEAQESFLERLTVPPPPAAERADKARFTALLGSEAIHQGVAVLVEPLEPIAIEDALERPGPVLVLDQVTDPRNVGAILRSAAAFGAACVVMQDRHAPEESAALAKAASGALEVVPLVRVVNLARCLDTLKQNDCWVVGLDAGGGHLDGTSFQGRRAALVLGSEGDGLRRLTREHCDEIAGLSMPGTMESLNVSVAAAIGLYELTRAS